MQQNVDFFADPQHVNAAVAGSQTSRRDVPADLTSKTSPPKNQDYAAATNGFINGAGGVYLVGTWLIGDFDAESRKPDRPLSNGYAVMPWPQLYAS